MQMSTRRDDGVAHVSITGELDLASGQKLDAELRRALEEGASSLELDLSDCTFIDSAGIGVLLRWREDAETGGPGFVVTGARGAVRRVFQVTGVLGD